MILKHPISPFFYPITFFGATILGGSLLLKLPLSTVSGTIHWIDALFTAISATCVTGLTAVDTGTTFTRFGHCVILGLIQVGGLGIMTFTSLAFYLWRHRVSLSNRVAVGQSLLNDQSFNLAAFLVRILLWTLLIEIAGALLLHLQSPAKFDLFAAAFHAVSAFCNAGFALTSDSLMAWRGHWGINLVIMALIVAGGIGFAVLVELQIWISGQRLWHRSRSPSSRLSWYAKIVITTSIALIGLGSAAIYMSESVGYHGDLPFPEAVLSALFQSVTCRTAGFNTLDIGRLTNVTLFVMIFLMFIGGAPGSCAGGIKVTTLRTLLAFFKSHLLGHRQATVGRFAVDPSTINKALLLAGISIAIILGSVFVLNVTEGADMPHTRVRGLSLEILFEAVSAFGTVGLSMGLTPKLTFTGKCIIMILMFIGRLGPLIMLAAVQSLHKERFFRLPEERLLIG
jgi:trk system potassium uptake protein TrkH